MSETHPRLPRDDGFWWNDIDCPKCGGNGFVQEFNGAKARSVRCASMLTLRSFARRVGFSAPFIFDVELGRRRPNAKVIEMYRLLEHNLRKATA